MGIITSRVDKYINKLKSEHPYEYDSLLTPDRMEQLQSRFTRNMLINSAWYAGNDLELKQLYEKDLKAFKLHKKTSDELNYFWAQPTDGTNIRKIHSGIPQLITEKMVDLLLSNGYEYTVYKDKELTERDDDVQDRLENILLDNNFAMQLQEGIETESWSGGVAFKLSFNKRFKYPIIEVIQPEDYEPVIEAGRIVEDIFIKYFSRKHGNFKLKERYGIDTSGGFIKYELYRHTNGDWVDAKLSDLDETKDLKDTSFKGIFEKFSIYKPNKLPNSEFRGSRLGESDYSGSQGLFDALDEVISAMIQEFRDGKIKNFWPSNLLPVDPTTNKQYMPPTLKKDFIVYNSGIGEKEKASKPELVQGEIHSEKYLSTYMKLMESILNNAGLSPQTVGLTGLESTAASEESQELREKTSIRTREKKIATWTPSLENLFILSLKIDDLKNGKKPNDYVVDVNFNDYKIQTMKDKTEISGLGIASGSWDLKTAIDYVHEDKTDEERILIRVNSKIERGINVFTKEEEIIYKKYVMEVEAEQPVVEEAQVEEPEEEVVEDIEEDVDGTIS